MYELIALIILIGSILGISIILLRKIPALIELPEVVEKPQERGLTLKLKKRVGNVFPKEIVLQKTLSRFRILMLKIEKKTDDLLQKLRKKSKEKQKTNDSDKEEWQDLKGLIEDKFKDLPR